MDVYFSANIIFHSKCGMATGILEMGWFFRNVERGRQFSRKYHYAWKVWHGDRNFEGIYLLKVWDGGANFIANITVELMMCGKPCKCVTTAVIWNIRISRISRRDTNVGIL